MNKETKKRKNYNKVIFVSIFLVFEIILLKYLPPKKEEKTVETLAKIETEQNTDNTDIHGNEREKIKKEIDSNSSDWNLMLVNKDKLIPEDYNVQTEEIDGKNSVDYRIADSAKRMLQDARNEGLSPIVCSSYRSTTKQKKLFNNKISEYLKSGYSADEAKEKASLWVAVPGTSEHEIGLAMDIVSLKYQVLDEEQENTEEQKWLMQHCNEYGFILRYPTEKVNITQINYEPWHYRYVGVENAKFMTEKNYCLEEFIEYLKSCE